jgi:hypothetical protein
MTEAIATLTTDKNNDLHWVVRSETPTANKYFPARAWIKIDRNGIVAESVESVGVSAPSEELRTYAIAQSKKMPSVATYGNAQATPARPRRRPINLSRSSRSTCLNCGVLPVAYAGCNYCTDCHGEV